jgi:signal transduction histidine kinase
MTRRITWTILLTVWATFVVIGLTAYFTTRAIMLAHLHHAMQDELMAGKKVEYQGRWYVTVGSRHEGDREPLKTRTQPQPHAEMLDSRWVTLPGESYRFRSIRARVYARPEGAGEGSPLVPIEATYTRRADEFDPLMNALALALVTATFAAGVIAAVLARLAATTSLRPLRATAEVIGTIDDRTLDRRIDARKLPPELVPMAEKLNGMLQRLETSMHQRQHFLADASHELRTPVAALMSALELSTRRPRDVEYYRRLVDDCLVDAKHLRRLVEALMTQVKSELPAASADEWESVDLGAILTECATIVAPLAEEKSVRLAHPAPGAGALRTQPRRLRSVVINLMANAIEYNRSGGLVEVTCEQFPDAVEIRVRDTGPGIAPEHVPHVFEPFYRADRAREASEHMGLGLFLVESHVQRLGGTCAVESTLGQGTTFRVRLPGILVKSPPQATAPATHAVNV